MSNPNNLGNVERDVLALKAREFLRLQAETKDWIESVLGADLANKDLHAELKSGKVLCKLMNTLFPGAVRNVHKANFGHHQIENIGFALNCLRKMGMKEDQLFEPLDLHEKKNMMKVFRCIASFAEIVSGSGKARRWKKKSAADFTQEEIAEWKEAYGKYADEMEIDVPDAEPEVEEEEEAYERPDDVEVLDSSMFPAPANVTLKSLGVTLDDLIRAVDEVEKFRDDDPTDKSPQQTADDTEEAAVIAAQFAAQVKAFGEQQAAKAGGDDAPPAFAAFKDKMAKHQRAIDAANADMVRAHNQWQEKRDDPAAARRLFDACEELKRVARNAYADAQRLPARCADVPTITEHVTDEDVDVSLAELVKAVRKAQAIDECKPHETTGRTEDGSRKAARFAGQIKKVGDQNAHAPAFRDKMHGHAERIQAANRDFVDANNRYVDAPESKSTQRAFDDACEELIRVATNAARDAKRRPPLDVKRAYASDYPVDSVTSDDLARALKEVIKTANQTEAFKENTPAATAANAEGCSVAAAKLEAMVQWVGDKVRNKELARRITKAAAAIGDANGDMCDAAKAHAHDEESEKKQRALHDACEELKRVAAAAVSLADEGLASLAKVPATVADEPTITEHVSDDDIDVSLAELVKAVRKAQDLDSADTVNATAERTTVASRKAARFGAQVRKVGDQNAEHPAFRDRLHGHADRIAAANKDMVDACNRLQDEPDSARLQREFDEACEELIRVATNAARDAKRRPGPPVKRSRAADFSPTDVTADDLARMLKQVIKHANRTDKFKEQPPMATGEAATDTSAAAAELEAMVRWVGDKVRDKELARRIKKAAGAMDDANGDLCDAANAHMGDEYSKPKQRALHDACDEIKRVCAAAVGVAGEGIESLKVPDARLALPSEFPQRAAVGDGEVDESVGAIAASTKRVGGTLGDGGDPRETTEATNEASKDAARFAARCAKVGDQCAHAPVYDKRMHEHADRVQDANKALVDANNRYIREPESAKLRRAVDDALGALNDAAAAAARDAKRPPPPKIKCARAADYPTDDATKDELNAALQDEIKAVNKLDKFESHAPAKTGNLGDDATKKAAKLEAKVRAVAGRVKQRDLRKRILAAAGELEDANQAMVDAANAHCGDEQSKPKTRALHDANDALKKAAAASVSAAHDGIDSLAPPPDDEALADIDPESAPLHFATMKGDIDTVKKLVDKGLKIATPIEGTGWTPLYTACYVGNLALVRFFMEQGADVNVTNKEGFTPLFAAVSQGHKHVVGPLLTEYKAKVNVQSKQGTTALYHAAEGGRYSIAKQLLDAGAKVDLGKEDGWTPLQGAVFNYHAKVTRLLIESGADVNRRNHELKKYCALHIAISSKRPNMDVIKMLASRADLDVKNKNGATPLHLACMWGHEAVAKELIQRGASMKIANNKGRQALEVAVRNGHATLASYIANKLGVSVPKLAVKKTEIAGMSAPAAPPPPDEESRKQLEQVQKERR